jgi:hypothetical protein
MPGIQQLRGILEAEPANKGEAHIPDVAKSPPVFLLADAFG